MLKSSCRCWLFVVLILSVPAWAYAQAGPKKVSVQYHSGFSFLDHSVNKIEGNSAALRSFFERLFRLRGASKDPMQVPIFHLGDSHLQAGFLGGTIMRCFQRDFGNAGRGLITPLRLAKTNEPFDYDIVSSDPWSSSRCVSLRPPFGTGIGGIALRTQGGSYEMKLICKPQSGISYAFNKVRIFHAPNAPEEFRVLAGENSVISYTRTQAFLTEMSLSKSTSKLEIQARHVPHPSSSIYGFSLENGHSGVLYHAVGLNGAQFFHYKRIDHFGQQIHSLNPLLIIVSLGTNEAFRGKITESQIFKEIESLIMPIRQQNPQAAILMTTPAECQYRTPINGAVRYVPNPNIKIVRNAILRYAQSRNLPYWDLYRISGGDGSSENWINSKMLARDRVHFEVSGYRVQGNLFYQALMYGYNAYVASRNR